MKKTLKSFFVFVAAALTLVGCQKKEIEQPQTEGEYVYTFTIDDATRAVIGDSNIEWVDGDRVGMFVGDYKGYANIDVTTTPKMVVLYSNSAIPAGTMAYAYAPYDDANKNAESARVKIVMNNIQSGSQVSAMPLAGLPFEVEEEIDPKAQEGNGQIKFMNLGSLINFKIFSSNAAYQSETIQFIEFEAAKAIAGVGYIDLTAVDMDDEGTLELDMDTEETVVKVNEEMPVVADKESAIPIKMVILPGTFDGTLTVTTNVATYTKVIPEREFARSHSRSFSLDLANAERTEGVEEVIKTIPYEEAFTSNQGDFKIENVILPEGMSTLWAFSSTYGAKVTAYDGSDNHTAETWLVSPWIDLTAVAGAAVSFDHAGNYFANTDAIKNECTLWAKSDEDGAEWAQLPIGKYFSSWTFVNSGEISLGDYVGKKVKVAFKYTSTASKSGTWEIKNFSAHIVKADPELSFETTQFTVNIGDDFTAPTLVNPHGVTVVYSSNNEDVALVDENTGEVVIGGAGVAVITASFAGDDNYLEGSAFYSISVVDPTAIPDPETIVFADLELENSVQYTDPFSGGNFLVSFGDGENDGKYYTTGSGIRTYADGKIYISSSYDIVRIEYTFASSYSPVADKFTVNTGTLTPGTTSIWTGSAKSIILTNTGTSQWRLQSVKVYYTEPEIPVYNIVIDSSSHGTVSANVEQAEEGTLVTLTITPDAGYKLESLIVNDENVTNAVSNGTYVFSMPDEDVTVSASFALIPVGEVTYTLSFPDDNSDNNKVSGYVDTWTATIGSTSWTISNFNNNSWNNSWSYIKCGRKNVESVGTIVTKLDEAIKTVKVTVDAATVSKVNSFTLYVATDDDFSTNVQTIPVTLATGDNVFTITTPTEDCYYKLEIDCASGSSNGLVTISRISYSTN